ncbi:MAG: TPM domain-containing protein, partial [Candidatus Peregrinibacteria bacterium]
MSALSALLARCEAHSVQRAAHSFLLISSVIVSFLYIIPRTSAAFAVPPNDGYVTDMASILSPEDKTSIADSLKTYKDQTSNELAVLIMPTLGDEPIADASVQVFRQWKIGQQSKNNGLLMLIAYTDRKIFISTGLGLEGVLPDIVVKGVIERDITPLFRTGDYAGGIRAGIASLQKHIGGEYTADRYTTPDSSGGGFVAFAFFFAAIILQWMIAFLGKTKSWWLGGAIGSGVGFFLALLYTWWWSIPVLGLFGLLLDFVASKLYKPGGRGPRGRGGMWFGGGFGGGSTRGGGGFGGFSGGT